MPPRAWLLTWSDSGHWGAGPAPVLTHQEVIRLVCLSRNGKYWPFGDQNMGHPGAIPGLVLVARWALLFT